IGSPRRPDGGRSGRSGGGRPQHRLHFGPPQRGAAIIAGEARRQGEPRGARRADGDVVVAVGRRVVLGAEDIFDVELSADELVEPPEDRAVDPGKARHHHRIVGGGEIMVFGNDAYTDTPVVVDVV